MPLVRKASWHMITWLTAPAGGILWLLWLAFAATRSDLPWYCVRCGEGTSTVQQFVQQWGRNGAVQRGAQRVRTCENSDPRAGVTPLRKPSVPSSNLGVGSAIWGISVCDSYV